MNKVAFKEAVDGVLTEDKLKGLRMYQVVSPTGAKLIFQPIIRKAGASVSWCVRCFYPGAMGYIRVNKTVVESAGFPSDYLEKSHLFLAQLNEEYGILPAGEAKLELIEGKLQEQREAEGLPELKEA